MATEIEKTFFDTFGIEPRDHKGCSWGGYCPHEEHIDCGECSYWETWKTDYPQISDRILLELICIIHQADLDLHGEEYYFESLNYKDLKEEVIAKCKRLADKNAFSEATGEHIKHQVRTLFKEG